MTFSVPLSVYPSITPATAAKGRILDSGLTMTFLASHLPFPSSPSTSTSAALPPPGTHLLISDTLKSPAHFAVYHIVAAALAQKCTVRLDNQSHRRRAERQQVIWVDIRGEGRASLEAVLKKLVSLFQE